MLISTATSVTNRPDYSQDANGWDGLLPVPGDGRYEWDGFYDMDVLPEEYNPERGYTGTANSMNLPTDYPIEKYPMGFEWTSCWRYERLWTVLAEQQNHSLHDSSALQRDYLSMLALQAIDRIPGDLDGPGVEMLRGWDGVLSPDSAAAAYFAIWYYRHLRPALAFVLLPDAPELVSDIGFVRRVTPDGGRKIPGSNCNIPG